MCVCMCVCVCVCVCARERERDLLNLYLLPLSFRVWGLVGSLPSYSMVLPRLAYFASNFLNF